MFAGGIKTRSWWAITLFIISVTLVEVTLSAPCTPETCPDSPVIVSFEKPDCTGRRSYESLDFEWGTCFSEDGASTSWTFTDNYAQVASYYDPNCGSTKDTSYDATRQYFGNCFDSDSFPTGSANRLGKIVSAHHLGAFPTSSKGKGIMYLRNAKQPFKSPQYPVINPKMPFTKGYVVPCANLDDCASKGPFFTGDHDEKCTPYAWYVLNVTANACQRTLSDFETFSCLDKHTIEVKVSGNSDCSRPIYSLISGGLCNGVNVHSYYCNAKPSEEIQPKSNLKMQFP